MQECLVTDYWGPLRREVTLSPRSASFEAEQAGSDRVGIVA